MRISPRAFAVAVLGLTVSCAAAPSEAPAQAPPAAASALPSPPKAAPESRSAPEAATPVAAAPSPVVDAQGCVRDTLRHGIQFILQHHGATVAERLGRAAVSSDFEGNQTCLAVTSLPDVDGDNVNEVVVSEGCSWGNAASLQLLYFSGKGCPAFAGDIVDGELTPTQGSASGVRDLEATWSNGCAGNDFGWSHYRWDGKAYKVMERATCSLCSDAGAPKRPPGANSHPHCKAEAKARAAASP